MLLYFLNGPLIASFLFSLEYLQDWCYLFNDLKNTQHTLKQIFNLDSCMVGTENWGSVYEEGSTSIYLNYCYTLIDFITKLWSVINSNSCPNCDSCDLNLKLINTGQCAL